jgi:hypothetical protein
MSENPFSLKVLDFFKENLLICSVKLCYVLRPTLLLDVSTLSLFYELRSDEL